MKRIKHFIFTLAATLGFMAPVAVPVAVYAQDIQSNLCAGAEFNPDITDCDSTQGASEDVGNLIKLAIDLFSLVVGVIAVIMIIVGGVKYITSGGDSGNVTGAKNTILYAVIGLVIVAIAQIVVRFVLGEVDSATT